ncbi:RecX family transcriptional regulator [Candidatus Gracilibacteria bacterium]|nr:RecX family transcriptional regulator [Candidatus Gracilibacteria bacterium]
MRQKFSPRSYGLKVLSRREHSCAEFKEKLKKKFPEEKIKIEEIIIEFIEKSWLSEKRFCEAFTRDQILKKSGPQKIFQKLLQKGVERDIAKESVNKVFPQIDQASVAEKLAEKKYKEVRKRRKDDSEFEVQQKVLQFLIGRGFDFDMSKNAVRSISK